YRTGDRVLYRFDPDVCGHADLSGLFRPLRILPAPAAASDTASYGAVLDRIVIAQRGADRRRSALAAPSVGGHRRFSTRTLGLSLHSESGYCRSGFCWPDRLLAVSTRTFFRHAEQTSVLDDESERGGRRPVVLVVHAGPSHAGHHGGYVFNRPAHGGAVGGHAPADCHRRIYHHGA